MAPNFPWDPGRFPFFYGWIIVLGATVGTIFTIPGQTMGFSVFTDILMEELGLSRVALSLAYCVGTVASGLMLPWMGRLLDKWGDRRMTVISTLVTGGVLFYLSVVADLSRFLSRSLSEHWQMVCSFVCIGFGFFMIRIAAQGVLSMTCRNVMGKWFDVKRGMALAFSGVFVSFGFSLAPRWLNHLVEQYGYEGAWRIIGILTLVVMGPLGWLVFRDRPEDCGLLMDGAAGKAETSTNMDMIIHHDFTLKETLRTFSFWVFNLSFAFYAMFATAFTFHILSIGSEFQFTKERMLTLFIPMALVSVSTNLSFGWINTRMRLKHLLVIMNLGGLAGVFGLYQLTTSWGVAAYVIGNGIAGGGFVSLSGIIWPRFFGRLWLGSISGINMSTMVIASGMGPLIFGWSEQWGGSYRPILLMSMIVPSLLAVLSFWADNPQRKLGETISP
ncbi:MFS transporter [bacterium]|nr:MFS transporter [bacterium]